MNKEYLPFYDSLSQKDKDFWLKCSKETLIDHFISNVRNGEELLSRLEDIETYIHLWKLDEIDEKTMLILNDILLIKNGMKDKVVRLKEEGK